MEFIKDGFKYILIEVLKYILITFAIFGGISMFSDAKITISSVAQDMEHAVEEAKKVTPEMLEEHIQKSVTKKIEGAF